MTAGAERRAARVRAIRARAAVRRWELGQRDNAAGVWDRVARVLTSARCAWAIDDGDAERLLAAGHRPAPAGLELQPPRRLFVLSGEEIARLGSARPVALRASAELLNCRNLALLPFAAVDDAVERVDGSG
jgi:hypothetical protein